MTAGETILEIFRDAHEAMKRIPKVFPMYIAARARDGLRESLAAPNLDFPGAEVGDMQTIGDCRYAITITDKNGQRYRVTIEVVR